MIGADTLPNIVYILADDLGYGDVKCNNPDSKIPTPNVDRLAKEGMRFTDAHTPSAVCTPTRYGILTGRYCWRTWLTHRVLDGYDAPLIEKGQLTVPALLKKGGYQTACVGKWHLGTLTTKVKDANRARPGDSTHYSIPTMNGYDTYFVTESKVPTYDPMFKPTLFDTEKGESLRYGWKAVQNKNSAKDYGTFYWKGVELAETENLDGDDSKIIMDRVIPFIENSVINKNPFFSTVWIHKPHLPIVANGKMMAEYSNYSYQEQIYYATISAMDKQVGRLWKKLEELGEAENTMIWVCSDNGPERGTPGSSGTFRELKRSLYEGGVRVPAFCVWPAKIKPGLVSDIPTVTSDYLPTIVDILKLNYPENRPVDGVSLAGVLNGNKKERTKPIGFRYQKKISWVTQKYKLISIDKGATFELYNLLDDREERNNIASENTELVNTMKSELFGWIESCKKSDRGVDY
ncbi:MAG: sulfatase-like hydrolase/transferase [Draconibacterium sp.]|nr:sulfatase-like hydrolase/transferase [Draconibacterium sp.]